MKTTTCTIIAAVIMWTLSASAQEALEMRYWTDHTGIEQIQAALQDVDGSDVILFRNGQTRRVPINRLSRADQDYVTNWVNFREAAEQKGIVADASPPAASPATPAAADPFGSQPSAPLPAPVSPSTSIPEASPFGSLDTAMTTAETSLFPATEIEEAAADSAPERAGILSALSGISLSDFPMWLKATGGAALVIILTGAVFFLVAAFSESILWGLGVLILPLTGIVFLFMHWHRAKGGFLTGLAGTAIFMATVGIFRWQNPGVLPF